MLTINDNMLNKKVRRKENGLIVTSNKFEVLVTKSWGRSKIKYFHKRDKLENHDKSKTRKYIICYNCDKVGHIKINCMFLKSEYSRERD